MKTNSRVILAAALLLTVSTAAFGQRKPLVQINVPRNFAKPAERNDYSLRISASAVPNFAKAYFVDGSLFGDNYYGDYDSDSYGGLVYSTGTIALGLDIILSERLAFSADFGFCSLWQDIYSVQSDSRTGSNTGTALYLVPQLKYYYYSPVRSLRLYSSVGLGLAKYCNFDKLKYSYRDDYSGYREFVDKSLRPAFEIAPFGLEVGENVFGFMEVGFGSMYTGVKFGLGTRF